METFVLVLTCAVGAGGAGDVESSPPPVAKPTFVEDFDAAWSFVRDRYAFFPNGPGAWDVAREHLRSVAEHATTEAERIGVLELLLDQLADPHCHLRVNLASSHRLVPHDVWGVRTRDGLRIEAVRRGSAAAAAGVRPGDVVTHIQGRPALAVADEVRPRFSPMPDDVLDRWSALVALAGTHDVARVWTLTSGGASRTVRVDAGPPPVLSEPPVSASEPVEGVGLLRISTFAEPLAVEAFDRALDRFLDEPALILDVRDNHGGDTRIARPMMGRFVTRRTVYATMRRREGERLGEAWAEFVEPRGEPYRGRIVVLVNRFSASMAEGFAMGMRAIAGATLVGTSMAGLGAAIGTMTLPATGIPVQISTEPVYTPDGVPRSDLRPDVLVPVEALRGDGDAVLAAALRSLRG